MSWRLSNKTRPGKKENLISCSVAENQTKTLCNGKDFCVFEAISRGCGEDI